MLVITLYLKNKSWVTNIYKICNMSIQCMRTIYLVMSFRNFVITIVATFMSLKSVKKTHFKIGIPRNHRFLRKTCVIFAKLFCCKLLRIRFVQFAQNRKFGAKRKFSRKISYFLRNWPKLIVSAQNLQHKVY